MKEESRDLLFARVCQHALDISPISAASRSGSGDNMSAIERHAMVHEAGGLAWSPLFPSKLAWDLLLCIKREGRREEETDRERTLREVLMIWHIS